MQIKKNVFIPSIYILFLFLTEIASELYTSSAHIEELLHTESDVVKILGMYMKLEEQRLQKVKQLQRNYEKLHLSERPDDSSFLSNPVNAFLLIKRLTSDWNAVKSLAADNTSQSLIGNLNQQRKFPDEKDLSGAATALLRLQDIYLLQASTLAQGRIEGTISTTELTAGDCRELGLQALSSSKFNHSILWMEEALHRLEKEDYKTADKIDILEHMANSSHMMGYYTRAIKLTNDVLAMNLTHTRALKNKEIYEEQLKKQIGNKTEEIESYISEDDFNLASKKLCRGERVKSNAAEKNLYCRYFTNESPHLLLQPIKEEILNLNPRIHIYHDALSDKEMDVVKSLAMPKLQKTQVYNEDGQPADGSRYRTSKATGLVKEDHSVIERINRRVGAVTGLNMTTAETLQVANYGIGGHYTVHYDFALESQSDAFAQSGRGNRIATWLNYMGDVQAGGYTVFPEIGVHVKPIKGSAVFWYNLLLSGKGDIRTLHAGCPVLSGTKWISTYWLRERGQEFRRKCSLDENK